jgi:CxxC motif-containing protein (DUF1111 family)
MKRPSLVWFLSVLVVALVPVGLRVWSWRTPRHEIDPAMAQAGEALFSHSWKPADPLAQGGDGLGPVFNATSCVACHKQSGVGGSGGLTHNVTVFTDRRVESAPREGVIHAHSTKPEFRETMALVETSMPATSQPNLNQLVSLPGSGHCLPFPRRVHFSQRNTPALFGDRLIDEIPDREIIAQERQESLQAGLATASDENVPVGRALRLADGRVGKFGWKAQSASLSDFVQAACANELGLGNPGQAQPRSLARLEYQPRGLDLSQEQCDQLTAFVASLPRPAERTPLDPALYEQAELGKKLFGTTGCADCHTPTMGSVEGLYSDLLLHRMGQELQGGGSYNDPPIPVPTFSPGEGPQPGEWRTPPLWGVADSAPYLHDGRALTLDDAIRLHAGQGKRARDRYVQQGAAEKAQLIAFLTTLRAPGAE